MARASVTGTVLKSGLPLKARKHYEGRITDVMLLEKTNSLMIKGEVVGSEDDKEFDAEGYEFTDYIELNLAKDFPSEFIEKSTKKKTSSFFEATEADPADFDTDEFMHKNIVFAGYTKEDKYEGMKYAISVYFHSQG